MQLFALDPSQSVTHAALAAKGKDYSCVECGGVVRKRGGGRKRNHFFHLAFKSNCRQNGKSQRHLATQEYIFGKLPPGEAVMECPFPAVGRVADVAWIKRGIVFEVQCSYITHEEVAARNRDYLSQGFQVVWVLSDRRYNRRYVSAAEEFLLGKPTYYTNIDEAGHGEIYDQAFLAADGLRYPLSPKCPIEIGAPLPLPKVKPTNAYYRKREQNSPFCFKGDLLDRRPVLSERTEKRPKTKKFLEIYHNFLHLVLEWLTP